MWHTVIVVGNLGRDPEMRYTASGQPVTSFSVATSRQYTSNSGQQVKETVWFRVSVWGKQAETCNQYLKKGSKVLIEGILKGDENGGPRIWTDKEGQPRASFELTANTVRFLSSRQDGEGGMGGGMGTDDFAPISGVDEEIPF